MRGKIYTQFDREESKRLVIKGKSYGEISKSLGIPKSTLSTWYGRTVKKPVNRSGMLLHLAKIRHLAVSAIKQKYSRMRAEEDRQIEDITRKQLVDFPYDVLAYKAMAAFLYWAEGAKHERVSGLKFINTDLRLCSIFLNLLRRCYTIDNSKIRITLHVHYYHSIKAAKKFWSDGLSVPLGQFNKVYIKERSKTKKFRKNFAGICLIYYPSSRIRKELLVFGTLLAETIDKKPLSFNG